MGRARDEGEEILCQGVNGPGRGGRFVNGATCVSPHPSGARMGHPDFGVEGSAFVMKRVSSQVGGRFVIGATCVFPTLAKLGWGTQILMLKVPPS